MSPFISKDKADRLFSPGSKGNPIDHTYDYGVNLGFPVVRDRLWFWGAYGVQRIDQLTITGVHDKTDLDNITAKLNAQFGRHMTELFFMGAGKTKDGRYDIGPTSQAPEATWIQGQGRNAFKWFGKNKKLNPILKVQDDFFASDDLFISLKGAYVGGGFTLEPKGGRGVPVVYDLGKNYYTETYVWQGINRPTYQLHTNVIYHRSQFLGGSHEIKVGGEFRYAKAETDANWGNGMEVDFQNGVPDSVWLYGQQSSRIWIRRFSAYLQDIYTLGRLTLTLGLRFDNQVNGTNSAVVPPNDALGEFSRSIYPGFTSKALDGATWNTFSPRIGFTYDLTGDAKTVLKANFAIYPETLGTQGAATIQQSRLLSIRCQWRDLNGDGMPQVGELGAVLSRNFDPADPLRNVNAIASDFTSSKRLEFTVDLDRQLIGDLAVGVSGFYRRNYDFAWTIPYDPNGQVTVDQMLNCWVQQGTIPQDFGGWPYYYCTIPRPPGNIVAMRPDYHQTYWGAEVRVNKRMSQNWMLTGSFTWQNWKQRLDSIRGHVSAGTNLGDPTNFDQLRDAMAFEQSAGSGRAEIFFNTRWMAKLGTVVRLPLDFNVGATLVAREGFLFLGFWRARRTSNLWGPTVDVLIDRVGDARLPTFWMLNARVEKMFNLGSAGRLYLTVDGFNVTNNDIELGWFRQAGIGMTPNPNFKKITELVAPRVFRLGIRYEL